MSNPKLSTLLGKKAKPHAAGDENSGALSHLCGYLRQHRQHIYDCL